MDLIGGKIKTAAALHPIQTSGGSADAGVIIDRLGFESMTVVVQQGAVTGSPTGVSAAYKVEHGDAANLSDAADLLAAVTVTGTTGNKSYESDIDLAGAKRYVRLSQTVTFTGGTTPKVFTNAVAILGTAKVLPA